MFYDVVVIGVVGGMNDGKQTMSLFKDMTVQLVFRIYMIKRGVILLVDFIIIFL